MAATIGVTATPSRGAATQDRVLILNALPSRLLSLSVLLPVGVVTLSSTRTTSITSISLIHSRM